MNDFGHSARSNSRTPHLQWGEQLLSWLNYFSSRLDRMVSLPRPTRCPLRRQFCWNSCSHMYDLFQKCAQYRSSSVAKSRDTRRCARTDREMMFIDNPLACVSKTNNLPLSTKGSRPRRQHPITMPCTSASTYVGNPCAYVREMQGHARSVTDIAKKRTSSSELMNLENVCARLDSAEHVLSRQDSEGIRERRLCNLRKEQVSTRLQAMKTKKGIKEQMTKVACR